MNRLIGENVPLADKTTFRIGGTARYYAEPKNADQLKDAVSFARDNGIVCYYLGGGSNLLIADRLLEGLVVRLDRGGEFGTFAQSRDDPLNWTAGAAVPFPGLVKTVLEAGVSGPEELAGIPGTVGGAIKMNAGIPSLGLGDFVVAARLLLEDGTIARVGRDELRFSYRGSSLGGGLALSVDFRFSGRERAETLLEKGRRRLAAKAAAQPLGKASAGCIFKNHAGTSAGRLIDRAGGKGMRAGDAEISGVHANFIINAGHASASDVSTLIKNAWRLVRDEYGIELALEITTWGFDDDEFFAKRRAVKPA